VGDSVGKAPGNGGNVLLDGVEETEATLDATLLVVGLLRTPGGRVFASATAAPPSPSGRLR